MRELIKKVLLEFEGVEFRKIEVKYPPNHRIYGIIDAALLNLENPYVTTFFGDYDNDIEVRTKIFFTLDKKNTVCTKYTNGEITCEVTIKIEKITNQVIYDASDDDDPFKEYDPVDVKKDDIPGYVLDDFESALLSEIETFLPNLELSRVKFI